MDSGTLFSLSGELKVPLRIHHYQGGSFITHYHTFFEFMLINLSSGIQRIGGHTYEMKKGQVYFLNPSTSHTINQQGSRHLDYFNFAFQPEILQFPRDNPAYDSELLSLRPFLYPESVNPLVLDNETYKAAVELCALLLLESEQAEGIAMVRKVLLFNALLSYILPLLPQDYMRQKELITLNAVTRINRRFSEPLSSRDVAKTEGVSESRFCQIFKEVCGRTFKEELTARRLSEAKKLLDNTERPVGQVAAAAGFHDLSYFHRIFKEAVSLTPQQYRLRQRLNLVHKK